jgi:aldehyde:ferredoxin oxidoreductase
MEAAYGSAEAAEFVRPDGKSLNWKWAAPVVKRYHEHSLLKDCYILCDILFPFLFDANASNHVGALTLESRIFSAVTGREMNVEQSYKTGEMLNTLERALAVRDGRTRADDILHDIYFEKEDAGGRKYKEEDLETAKSDYYQAMGWDVKTGAPTPANLEKIGLKEIAEGLQKRAIPGGKS